MPDTLAAEKQKTFMRRVPASTYLKETYGFGGISSLAKGVVTGDTPRYVKAGRLVLYTKEWLDEWALSKIGPPQSSSSEDSAGHSLIKPYKRRTAREPAQTP
jgi:hypothetical protein